MLVYGLDDIFDTLNLLKYTFIFARFYLSQLFIAANISSFLKYLLYQDKILH